PRRARTECAGGVAESTGVAARGNRDPRSLDVCGREGGQPFAGARGRIAARHGGAGRRDRRDRGRIEREHARFPAGRRGSRSERHAHYSHARSRSGREQAEPRLGNHHPARRPAAQRHVARMSKAPKRGSPSLFEAAGLAKDTPRPLADRMRPRELADVVGQEALVGPDGALTRMLETRSLGSLIFWGPPGTGKTTVARLLAQATDLEFAQISAIFTGVADLKKVFEEARARREMGKGSLLFADEIHRFNRAQQDSFLPVMEDGTIILVGATTENPSFELNAPLLSRARVLVFKSLDTTAVEKLLARAEALEGKALPLDNEARAAL